MCWRSTGYLPGAAPDLTCPRSGASAALTPAAPPRHAWPRSHAAGDADRGRPTNTPSAGQCPRDAAHGQCRSVPYVPASARRNVHSRAGAVTRPAKAARRVRCGDGCPSWQRRISTDCAPSLVKSSPLALRYREGLGYFIGKLGRENVCAIKLSDLEIASPMACMAQRELIWPPPQARGKRHAENTTCSRPARRRSRSRAG
jgi:hypothetical protein